MTTPSIEAAARAMWAWREEGLSESERKPFPKDDGDADDGIRILAISCLETLLDPSEEVVEAMCRSLMTSEGEDPDRETTIADRPVGWMLIREDAIAALRAAVMKALGRAEAERE